MLRTVFLIVLVADPSELVVADTVRFKEDAYFFEDESTPTRGPYCGIYSLCGALKVLGHNVKCADLLQPQYVDSPNGSSLAALKLAVEDHGLYASPVTGLTVESLRASPCPIILHVNGLWLSSEYDHWVLYLGVEDGKARILDVPSHVELVPFPQLLAQWDNSGLLVSDRPVNLQPLVWTVYGPFLQLLAIALGLVVTLNLLQRHRRGELQSRRFKTLMCGVTEAVIITIVGASTALGWHTLGDAGFFRNHNAVAIVQASHISAFVPKLTADEFTTLLDTEKVVVVDARFKNDFEAGHVERAINIPVNSTPRQAIQMLAGIPANSRIVVYCQSKRCRFAEIVASLLEFNGFADVAVFSGGWREWKAHHKSED